MIQRKQFVVLEFIDCLSPFVVKMNESLVQEALLCLLQFKRYVTSIIRHGCDVKKTNIFLTDKLLKEI